ncbi:hypothetical protein BDZ89DRAFT_1045604 [Hymenopellis radicata]|nr:hypothetical protein BDZ89DRAFT_1045604 [Hymenopellis radicata]
MSITTLSTICAPVEQTGPLEETVESPTLEHHPLGLHKFLIALLLCISTIPFKAGAALRTVSAEDFKALIQADSDDMTATVGMQFIGVGTFSVAEFLIGLFCEACSTSPRSIKAYGNAKHSACAKAFLVSATDSRPESRTFENVLSQARLHAPRISTSCEFYEPNYLFDRFFENALGLPQRQIQSDNTNTAPSSYSHPSRSYLLTTFFRMDLTRRRTSFEFPGLKKEDVNIDVRDGRLAITGESKIMRRRGRKDQRIVGEWRLDRYVPQGCTRVGAVEDYYVTVLHIL